MSPRTVLSPEMRRAAVLAYLRGEPAKEVAKRLGVSDIRVRELAREARANVGEELAFWREVSRLLEEG